MQFQRDYPLKKGSTPWGAKSSLPYVFHLTLAWGRITYKCEWSAKKICCAFLFSAICVSSARTTKLQHPGNTLILLSNCSLNSSRTFLSTWGEASCANLYFLANVLYLRMRTNTVYNWFFLFDLTLRIQEATWAHTRNPDGIDCRWIPAKTPLLYSTSAQMILTQGSN